MNILVVDDEKDIRDTLQDVFEDEGHTVFAVPNGADAMDALRRLGGACVVVLDLRMPIMSGNEVYEAMQRDEWLSSTPVVVTTSDPARAPSGVLVMRKPLNLDRLIEAVNMLGKNLNQGP